MSHHFPDLSVDAIDSGWKIAIVRSLWHGDLTGQLADDAKKKLIEAGITEKNIMVIDVAGAFEIPFAIKTLIEKKKINGAIAFGIILSGETHHADLLAKSTSTGIMNLQTTHGIPIVHAILHVDSMKAAEDRVHGPRAVGSISADTLLHSLSMIRSL